MSIKLEDYSAKCIVVYGDTKVHKEKLKELGGKYNGNLSVGPGWVFSNKKREELMKWKESLPVFSSPPPSSPTKVKTLSEYIKEIENLKRMNEKLVEENKRLRKENEELNDLITE